MRFVSVYRFLIRRVMYRDFGDSSVSMDRVTIRRGLVVGAARGGD